MKILEVAVFTPLRRQFDYLSEQDCAVGARVLVPFARRELVGIVTAHKSDSELSIDKLKPIKKCLDNENFLTPEILSLAQFASQYYHHPLGDIFNTALPKRLREGAPQVVTQQKVWQWVCDPDKPLRGAKQLQALNILKAQTRTETELKAEGITLAVLKRLREQGLVSESSVDTLPNPTTPSQTALPLNHQQHMVLDALLDSIERFAPFLLAGVTGSGKTEIYLQLAEHCLQRGQQVLVLVPEIGLTPQMVERFQRRLAAPMVVIHSGLSDQARSDAWVFAKQGQAKIVLGTRSAIFTPMPQLGLIIIDEEHDASFKQQDSFRYHARDLAMVRAKQANIPILLGSATPCLETWYNAKQGKYYLCRLTERAGGARDPSFHIINTRRYKLNDAGLSKPLIQAIEETLAKGEQALLFINRRGYAPVFMCQHCGYIADCDYCESHLTVHQADAQLHCHHCGFHTRIPSQCPSCHHTELSAVGLGTEKIATNLERYFPTTPILRIDRDSTRKKSALSDMLEVVNRGDPCILVGTQMLAKGHHFKKVTTVGILNADNGLFNPDFRACERFAQLLLQVAGRAGRESLAGHVYIQTLHPDNQLLKTLIEQGYFHFAEHLLTERQLTELPPYAHLAVLRAQASTPERAQYFLKQAKHAFIQQPAPVNILGPIPAAMAKRANKYHYHLLIQANSRRALHEFMQRALNLLEQRLSSNNCRWQFEMDPLDTV